jgi:hypothetical protein
MLLLSPGYFSAAIFLSLPPSPLTPHSIVTCADSNKYSDGLMRWYHCNKLIEIKQLFHLGDCSQ